MNLTLTVKKGYNSMSTNLYFTIYHLGLQLCRQSINHFEFNVKKNSENFIYYIKM